MKETLKKCLLHDSQSKEFVLSEISKTNEKPLDASFEEVGPPAKMSRLFIQTSEKEETLQQETNSNAKGTSDRRELTLELVLSQFRDTITVLEPVSYEDYIQKVALNQTTNRDYVSPLITEANDDHDFKINLINALVDPEVVSLICKKLTNADS